MSDSVVETSTQGCFSSIMESIKGVLVGALFLLIATPLLFWNEGRAVKRAKDLATGRGAVVSVEADKVLDSNNGALVHLSGDAVGDKPLEDPEFGVSTPALKLNRVVEMYQWVEDKDTKTKKRVGGKKETTTTYTYKKKWSARTIDSSRFKKSAGHTNPGPPAYEAREYLANVSVGAFTLEESGVHKIGGATMLALKKDLAKKLRAEHPKVNIVADRIYLSGGASNPEVGDTRVFYKVVAPQMVTVVAAQQNGRLTPYSSKELNGTLELVSTGAVSAPGMFKQAEESNQTMTWILRVLGFVLNFAGLALIFGPLAAVANIIPLFGDIVEVGTKLVAGVGALGLSALVISIGWVFYRPLIGIPLLLLAVASMVFLVMKLLKARSKRAENPSATA